ncbi:MAG: HEAT repeat domain-containing protein [Clostridiales bacterium]|nr:HEAT repeat domain-containing protein [Clostridiales bacterium]
MFGSKISRIEKYVSKDKPNKIIRMLNDRDESTVLAAIDGLGRCRDEDAFNALVPLIHSPSEKVRIATARALGNTGRSKARVHLEHQRRVETSDAVKDAISAALTAVPTSD